MARERPYTVARIYTQAELDAAVAAERESWRQERQRMLDALELIAAPLGVDGENHMADVYRAREAIRARGGE